MATYLLVGSNEDGSRVHVLAWPKGSPAAADRYAKAVAREVSGARVVLARVVHTYGAKGRRRRRTSRR